MFDRDQKVSHLIWFYSVLGLMYGVLICYSAMRIHGGGHGYLIPLLVSLAPFSSLSLAGVPVSGEIALFFSVLFWSLLGAAMGGRSRVLYRRVLWTMLGLHYMGALLGLAYLAVTGELSGLPQAWRNTPLFLLIWCIVYPGGQVVLMYEVRRTPGTE